MLWHLLIIFGFAHANILKPIDTDYPADEGTSRIKSSRQQENLLPPINLMPNLQYRQAIPTNDWWGNLITRDDNLKNKPIFAEPYRIEVQTTTAPLGIHISYPYQYRYLGPWNANGAIQYYGHALGIQNIGFSATTFQAPKLHIAKWDDVGVSVVLTDAGGTIEADFVRGMAFVSANYTGLIPMLQTDHAITQFKQVHARKYIIGLNNGQKWAVYSSQDITLKQVGQRLIGDRKLFGVLRTALISAENSDENQYDAFAECQVVGGTVQASGSKQYRIVWKTKGLCTKGLLHFALVHHMDTLQPNTYEISGIKLNSATHGSMTGIVVRGKKWRLNEAEDVKIGFYPPRSPSREHMTKYKILELLQQDIRASWSIPQGGSYYFNGKAAQKYASLCLMAADADIVGDDKTLKTECIRKLQGIYTHYLENTWTHPLIYDEVYRGISSSEAFKYNDPWRDFGNTAFNDHHYHYGYWITASAILKHLDSTWSRMNELNQMVNLMVRDAANPSNLDQWFPRFRHFDWFVGHSYSHGVSPFADGKDQESTSEEINFHYGLMLWGNVSGNSNLEQLGKLMLKVNSRAINYYFLMTNDNKVHPKELLPNKVTGIFFDNKVDYATWFGPNREYIHGIQMIPVSPIQEHYRKKEFVRQEWEQVLSKIDIVANPQAQSAWQSLLFANVASVNQELALSKLAIVPMDDGLSRSWALYYAATRPP